MVPHQKSNDEEEARPGRVFQCHLDARQWRCLRKFVLAIVPTSFVVAMCFVYVYSHRMIQQYFQAIKFENKKREINKKPKEKR